MPSSIRAVTCCTRSGALVDTVGGRVAVAVTKLAAIEGIGSEFAEKLVFSGFLTLEGILAADMSDLEAIDDEITAEQAKAIWYSAEAAYIKEHGEITE